MRATNNSKTMKRIADNKYSRRHAKRGSLKSLKRLVKKAIRREGKKIIIKELKEV